LAPPSTKKGDLTGSQSQVLGTVRSQRITQTLQTPKKQRAKRCDLGVLSLKVSALKPCALGC